MIRRLNNWLAVKITKGFGSMWTAHAFMIYSFIPLIWIKLSDKVLFWSNAMQLWALPFIMVGQQLMSIGFNKKFDEMYAMIEEQGAMRRKELAGLKAVIKAFHLQHQRDKDLWRASLKLGSQEGDGGRLLPLKQRFNCV